MNYTRRVQDPPCPINGHEVRLPRVTHPAVTFQEEITALPISIGVKGLIDDLQDGLPRDEAIHSP